MVITQITTLIAKLGLLVLACSASERNPPPLQMIVWDDVPSADTSTKVINAAWLFAEHGLPVNWVLVRKHLTEDQRERVGLGCAGRRMPIGPGGYSNEAINFYLGRASQNCGVDRNVIYLDVDSSLDTLAHELSHALGIHGTLRCGHADECPKEFSSQNLMWRNSGMLKSYLSHDQTQIIANALYSRGQRDARMSLSTRKARGEATLGATVAYEHERDLLAALKLRYRKLRKFSKHHSHLGHLEAESDFIRRYRRKLFSLSP